MSKFVGMSNFSFSVECEFSHLQIKRGSSKSLSKWGLSNTEHCLATVNCIQILGKINDTGSCVFCHLNT